MIHTGLEGKIALITGANNPHGIGAATARALAAQGVAVYIHYLRLDPQPFGLQAEAIQDAHEPGEAFYHAQRTRDAQEVLDSILAAGGKAAAGEFDLTDPATPAALFDAAEAALGSVDILVNTAAHYEQNDALLTVSPAGLARTFAVNPQATALLTAEFVRRRQKAGSSWGRVINFSTDAAQAFPGQIAYGASKAAIESLTRSMALEVAALGITINAIAPGPVQTCYIPAEFEQQLNRDIPLGRLGLPSDIADMVVFLASDQAAWITGLVLKVSGGHNI